jgi:hypothetical protein
MNAYWVTLEAIVPNVLYILKAKHAIRARSIGLVLLARIAALDSKASFVIKYAKALLLASRA